MTKTRTSRSPRRPVQARRRPATYEPYVDPEGAVTIEEWRRTVAKTPAVHLVHLHDQLVA